MALSNSTINILKGNPYFDDFYQTSNVDPTQLQGDYNDFHRILFRPKFPVQSRELTQLQTILQAQMERFGKSVYTNGQAVTGGQLTIDTTVIAGKVLPTTNLEAFFNRTLNVGEFIFDPNNPSSKAHVLQYVGADEGITTDNYLILKYQGANTFSSGTVVQDAADAQVTATFASGPTSNVFFQGSIISIDEGIFFVSGFYVRVPAQTIVLNPFSTTPSFRVGLTIAEEIIDELDPNVGSSLLDPANNSAPGAHRFRIQLTLDKRSITSSADPDFIELCRVVNGQIQQTLTTENYVTMSDLITILAERTYDQAGDYIVTNFTPVIQTDPNAEDHFVLSLGPGKAYVRGYEITTTNPTVLEVRKGRTTANAVNRDIPTRVGTFVNITRLAATQPTNYFANVATVDIHCVNVASIDTSSSTNYAFSKIGTVKVRLVPETESVPANTSLQANNSVHKLFFYDVNYASISGSITGAAANGLATTATLAIANGVPAINNAIVNATIILGGSNSPVTGTFTVNNYTTNSTVASLTFKEFLPTLPNGNTTYQLLFQMKDVDAFAIFDASITPVTAPLHTGFDFQADVDPTSKVTGTPVGDTIISDTDNNGLLYFIPEQFPQPNSMTTNSATFQSWVSTTSNAQSFTSTNTNFTISVSGANFSLPVGTLAATEAQENLIIFDQTADANGRGKILHFSDTPGLSPAAPCAGNVSISQVGSTFNISFTYFNGDNTTTRSLVGVAKCTVIGLAPRAKTLIIGNTTAVMSNTNLALSSGQIEFYSLNAVANFAYSLKTADVFNLRKVLYKSSNTAFANSDLSTAVDVTNLFSLDTGMRDNSYQYSSMLAGPQASASIQPTGRLLVIFDWFQQSGQGYVSVDSYLSTANLLNGMKYETIPSYTSARFGTTIINLRDVLDFRPTRSNFDFTNTALVFAASDTTGNSTYLTTTGVEYLLPASDADWLGSYSYYLSRIDKVALSYDGSFHVIEGMDAVSPVAPTTDVSNLLLFKLAIPQYTLVNANGVPTGVSLTTFDHKRWLMKDISKIDDRVAHLEYYTALNSLEQLTTNTSVEDTDGNERFKNGILVDAFHDATVADVTDPDYTASIDQTAGECRTAFRSFVVQFAPDIANSTSFGITLAGDMAIPAWAEASFISQPLATHAISCNPFDVASFYGTLSLCPAVDSWKDTTTAPAQVIDLGGPTQAWLNANQPSFVEWGEWDSTYNGVVAVDTQRQYSTPPGWTPENHAPLSETETSYQDVTTSTTYTQQGTQFEYNVTSTTASLGNQIVDVSIVHFMRQRDIVFDASGLKPNANLYAFFDGTPVQNYIQQANVLQLTPVTGTSNTAIPFIIGQTVYVQKAVTGNVATVSANGNITGTGTKFQFEVVVGQLIRITQGVNTFDNYVTSIASNTQLTMLNTAPSTLSNATLYTLTPVTIADVAARYSGNTVTYTVKVVRAVRDSNVDSANPYPITCGSLRPDKQVLDAANTTTGANLLVPPSPQIAVNPFTGPVAITSAVIASGVVRSWTPGSASLRFDTDITDTLVSTPGTTIYFVSGPGAGTTANIVSYNAAIQTAVVDNSSLAIVAEQTTYSVGTPESDGLVVGNVAEGRAGTAAGVFHLQGAVFAVGTRNFRLTDNANNNTADSTTCAETSYTASGLSVTQQQTSVSSRQLGLVRVGPTSQSFTVQSTTSGVNFQTQYIDPLAETFLVDATLYPLGVFVTSIDLCFAAVPPDDIPVTLELRPVVNGYPSSNQLVPCCCASGVAQVSLRPDQVVTTTAPTFDGSTGAQVATRFQFPAPVQLMPGLEYAIVIRSDSDAYQVYTAELGNTVIGTSNVVAKQPYAGSFFKSQNASTWTESPFEDLMFQINRATWAASNTTPNTVALVMRSIAPAVNTTFDSMEFYPHDVQFGTTTFASYFLDIKPQNANTGDLTGEVAIRYFPQSNLWMPLAQRSMMQGSGGSVAANNSALWQFGAVTTGNASISSANTITLTAELTTTSTDVAPYIDLQKIDLLCLQHLINAMGLQSNNVMIVNPGSGYLPNLQPGLLTTSSSSPVVTGDGNTNFVTSVAVGDTIVVGGNVAIVVLSITNTSQIVATANAPATLTSNTFWRYGTLGGNNAIVVTVTPNAVTGTGANAYATIASNGKISGVVFANTGSGYILGPALSVPAPANAVGFSTGVTLQTAGSLSYNGETAPSGGNGLTRYITQSVTLADGFDAQDITVYFDAYRPINSDFYVYYKVLSGDQTSSLFDQQNWRIMTQDTDDSTISTSYYQFKPFQFSTPTGRALAASTDTTNKFKIFAIKIVMATSTPVNAPRIANFRAIALDT